MSQASMVPLYGSPAPPCGWGVGGGSGVDHWVSGMGGALVAVAAAAAPASSSIHSSSRSSSRPGPGSSPSAPALDSDTSTIARGGDTETSNHMHEM